MYKVIKEGKVIAITEMPRYIKQDGTHRNGAPRFVNCSEREAQGISIKGIPYNLLGRELSAELETVLISKADGGDVMTAAEDTQTALAALLVDVKYKQTLLDLGVSENA